MVPFECQIIGRDDIPSRFHRTYFQPLLARQFSKADKYHNHNSLVSPGDSKSSTGQEKIA